VRTGTDYATERGAQTFQDELAERVETRKEKPHLPEFTPRQQLVKAAVEADVERPYSMTVAQLAQALVGAGVSKGEVEQIISG
jgi:hypothetical protein